MEKKIVSSKIVLFTIGFTLIFLGTFYAMGLRATDTLDSSMNEENTLKSSERISFSELEERPDIVFNSYKEAYPDSIHDVYKLDGEWVMQMNDGELFYWAEGRILAEDKKDNWEEYRPYFLYPNYGTARDPSEYTVDDIQRLRDYTNPSSRGAAQLPQDLELMKYLLGVGNREETEKSLVSKTLFGETIRVNKVAATHLDSINNQVYELATTNAEVNQFLETLGDVSSFNWRVIAGTDRLSNHSYGLAIDVLPKNSGSQMIYWAWVRDVNEDWMLVPQENLWSPPQEVIDIFYNHGYIWGGTWPLYDNMHFEYRPETVELAKYVKADW